MPRWTPTEDWKGQNCFIIGGGPSLRGFDWSLLHNELTIGCNTAFTLGSQVCKICIFGDKVWFDSFLPELEKYEGVVFTTLNKRKIPDKYPWLWRMDKKMTGLHHTVLGWNGNTGSLAINLALILGAKRVFLLGFDMKRTIEHSNWHGRIIRPAAVKPGVYRQFTQQFHRLVADWHRKFPDREIINVTKCSSLGPSMFPWIDPDKFWSERYHTQWEVKDEVYT